MARINNFKTFLLIIAFTVSAKAQIGSPPETGFGAHSLALGRSAMASPHDALSGSWNPASITGLEKITATASKFHWGVAYSHKSVLTLRTGYDGIHMSAGAGLKLKGIILDYALNNWLVELDDPSSTGAFSLTYQF